MESEEHKSRNSKRLYKIESIAILVVIFIFFLIFIQLFTDYSREKHPEKVTESSIISMQEPTTNLNSSQTISELSDILQNIATSAENINIQSNNEKSYIIEYTLPTYNNNRRLISSIISQYLNFCKYVYLKKSYDFNEIYFEISSDNKVIAKIDMEKDSYLSTDWAGEAQECLFSNFRKKCDFSYFDKDTIENSDIYRIYYNEME